MSAGPNLPHFKNMLGKKQKFYFCSPKKLLISALTVSKKPESVFCVIHVDTAKRERRKMRQQKYILQQMKDSGSKCQERKDPEGGGERLCLHKQFSSSAGTTMHFFFGVWPMDWQSQWNINTPQPLLMPVKLQHNWRHRNLKKILNPEMCNFVKKHGMQKILLMP